MRRNLEGEESLIIGRRALCRRAGDDHMHAAERLETLMGEGGVQDCGKAQNCVEVCPKEIPLVDSIAVVSRQATKHMLFGWLLK